MMRTGFARLQIVRVRLRLLVGLPGERWPSRRVSSTYSSAEGISIQPRPLLVVYRNNDCLPSGVGPDRLLPSPAFDRDEHRLQHLTEIRRYRLHVPNQREHRDFFWEMLSRRPRYQSPGKAASSTGRRSGLILATSFFTMMKSLGCTPERLHPAVARRDGARFTALQEQPAGY